jgi:alpha-ribazole phosphatase
MNDGERRKTDARPCQVLLMRHAAPRRNQCFLGQMDVQLSLQGRRNLRWASEKLSFYPVEAVYSSDLRRALLTAEVVARNAGLTVELRQALREMHFGKWQGHSWEAIQQQFPRLARLWVEKFPYGSIPGAELFDEFKKRVQGGLRRIVQKHPGGCVLVVTHAGVIRVALGQALGIRDEDLYRMAQDYCSLNVIDYFQDGMVVRRVNG